MGDPTVPSPNGPDCTIYTDAEGRTMHLHSAPSCTKRHRCPDTQARVVEAAIAWKRTRNDPLATSREIADAAVRLEAAVRAMEGNEDAR